MVPHPCGIVVRLGQRETSPWLVQGWKKGPPTSESQVGLNSIAWIFFPGHFKTNLRELRDRWVLKKKKKSHLKSSFKSGVSKWELMSQIWPTIGFCKWRFIRTELCSFIYIFSMATFILWQSWVVAAKTIWPAKPKILLSGPLQKNLPTPDLNKWFPRFCINLISWYHTSS